MNYLLFLIYSISILSKDITLIPFRDGKKWGYCNSKKDIVIPCQYKDVSFFSHNRAVVKNEEDKWGIIDEKGHQIGQWYEYDNMFIVDPGVVEIIQDGKYGIMDFNGKVLAPCKYQEYINFYNSQSTWVKTANKYGALNPKGQEVIPPIYDLVSGPTEEGFAVKKDGKFALFDTKGKKLTEFIYDYALCFSDGMAVVKIGKNWTVLNKKLKVVLDLKDKYDFLGGFESGLSRVSKNNKWGFINIKGEEIVPVTNESTGCLTKGIFAYSPDGKKTILIDASGKIKINDLTFASAFEHDRAMVYKNGKVGFINPKAEYVAQPIYDEVNDYFQGRFTLVTKEGKKIIMDENGKECLDVSKYDTVSTAGDGIFDVYKEGNLIGYIDYRGTEYWKD